MGDNDLMRLVTAEWQLDLREVMRWSQARGVVGYVVGITRGGNSLLANKTTLGERMLLVLYRKERL